MTVVGVGIDLVDVSRLRAALDRTPQLARRLFLDDEVAQAEGHEDRVGLLAERFAVKESVMKALGRGISAMAFTDIRVLADDAGQPVVTLTDRAAVLAAEHGVSGWHVALTRTDRVAQAVVIAVG